MFHNVFYILIDFDDATSFPGYIGGAVLWRLLNHKDAGKYTFKVLVRSPERAKLFDKFGVEAVVGDLKEHEKLEKLCEEADYVINTVSCWLHFRLLLS